jgi:hypothetical protein
LLLELASRVGEHLGEALHHLGHQAIRLRDRVPRLVNEAGLDLLPARSEASRQHLTDRVGSRR